MSLLDKIKFRIPDLGVQEVWGWLTKSPKDVAQQIGSYHQMFRLGYYLSYWTGNETCFSHRFEASDIVMRKIKEVLGLKRLSLAVTKVTIDVNNGCFEALRQPYGEISGKAPERKFPLSKKKIKELDKKMTERPIDIDRDGTPEIATSLFRIDYDGKPEDFHLHYPELEKRLIGETLIDMETPSWLEGIIDIPVIKIPTAVMLKVSMEVYIIPSQSPDRTIKVTLPLTIHIFADL